MDSSKSRKESINGLEKKIKEHKPKEGPIKYLTKNGKEELVKRSTKDILIKNGSIKEEVAKLSTKDVDISKEEPTKDELSNENQGLKNKLVKFKEETKQLKELKEPSYLKDLTKYIKNLDYTIKQLATDLKKSTDAKSWEAISRDTIKLRRYANYYDVSNTITTAGASNPNDFDSAVYNAERVFEYLERYSEIIYVANDGTDNLYVIVSHGGRTRFSQEAPIYPGEIKFYLNVYEIRLRSPTAGLAYRVTEYRINNISEISSIPIEKANLHNQALPAANTNWLATDISPTNTPTTLMIEVAVSVAGSFRAVVTKGGNAQTVTFNVVSGPALVAGGVYIFDLLVHSGDSVNFTYSVTGGTIQILRVQELDSASA
ncbi:MAG: hypothetical protein EPN89_19970 [Methylovulum sp.]|nr:MAG: hypothetical protein EPN89_19970 [Methylovulum sp.]